MSIYPGPQPGGGGASTSITPTHILLTSIYQFGSTNTFILQLPSGNIVENVGSFFTVTSDATNGGYITVPEACTVSVSIGLLNTSGANQGILIKNHTALDNAAGPGDSYVQAYKSIANTYADALATTVYMESTDKLFFCASFTPNNTYPLLNFVKVTRIS